MTELQPMTLADSTATRAASNRRLACVASRIVVYIGAWAALSPAVADPVGCPGRQPCPSAGSHHLAHLLAPMRATTADALDDATITDTPSRSVLSLLRGTTPWLPTDRPTTRLPHITFWAGRSSALSLQRGHGREARLQWTTGIGGRTADADGTEQLFIPSR